MESFFSLIFKDTPCSLIVFASIFIHRATQAFYFNLRNSMLFLHFHFNQISFQFYINSQLLAVIFGVINHQKENLIKLLILNSQFMSKNKKQEIIDPSSSEQTEKREPAQDRGLISLRIWMEKVEPIKLLKISEDIMTSMLETWSKFRISVLKQLNEQQNNVLDSMARLRKEIQWLNQVKLGKSPQMSKITSRLYKSCQQMIEKEVKFSLNEMVKQSNLVKDKILDVVKSTFENIKQRIGGLLIQFRDLSSIKQILTEKTYFKFLDKYHHSDIELISDTTVTVHNQSHDMDFGAVIGPALTAANYRVAICLDRNDKYQSFMGVGVCHPKIVKENYYKGTGPGSGCYVIRQQSDRVHAISLSHAYENEGSHRRQKSLPWGFGEGDVIIIEVNFVKKMINFIKGQDEFQMKLDLDQGPINPYVVLHSRWDSATIINS